MRRSSFPLLALLGLVLLPVTPAWGDPITITITGGTIEFDPMRAGSEWSVKGTGGFSFGGGSGNFQGYAGPSDPLLPGETTTFRWGSHPDGTVTYAGQSFTVAFFSTDGSDAGLELSIVSDSFVVPPAGPTTTTVVAPFTLTGEFTTPTLFAKVTGSGIGRLPLHARAITEGLVGWAPDTVHLDFTPTPEPNSLLLLGTGIAALGVVWRRKQRPADTGANS